MVFTLQIQNVIEKTTRLMFPFESIDTSVKIETSHKFAVLRGTTAKPLEFGKA